MMFLVVPNVSKMLLTLIAMLRDVIPLIIIVCIYIIFGTQIFSTLYQDINSNFDSIFKSFRTLFDTMIGNYEYGGSG